eukprot:1190344-Prorocentrum_minimum.AAC.1
MHTNEMLSDTAVSISGGYSATGAVVSTRAFKASWYKLVTGPSRPSLSRPRTWSLGRPGTGRGRGRRTA